MEKYLVADLDKLSHWPVIGIAAGAARITYGTIKTAIAIIQSLGIIYHGRSDLKKSNITVSMGQMGRGIVEMIPLLGRVFAITLDQRKVAEKAKELALTGEIDKAVETVKKETPWNYLDFYGDAGQDLSVQNMAEALIKAKRFDEAKQIYDRWGTCRYQSGPLCALVKHYTAQADDSSLAIANALTDKITHPEYKKECRDWIDSHVEFARRRNNAASN